MKKIIRYCDLCGKEITGQVYKVGFGILEGDQINSDTVLEDVEQDMDFCVTCIGNIAEMVRSCRSVKLVEEEEPKPVEKPKKDKKPKEDKRKKTDAGKIWALHDAGWNTSSIAMEAQCSTQTVRNILAKDRPDMEVSNA